MMAHVESKIGPKKSKTAEPILWTDQAPEQDGRQRQCDIVKGKLGLRTEESRSASTPREVFNLLITPSMIDLIVQSTNDRIKETIARLGEDLQADDTKSYIRATNADEVYGLIGLMYFHGLLGMAKQITDRLFLEKCDHPVFSATMSCKRFKFLSSHLSFDNAATRA